MTERAQNRFQEKVLGGRKLKIFLLLLVLIAVTFMANRWRSELKVESVHIKGKRIVTQEEIFRLANISPSTSLVEISLVEVGNRILKNPFIQEVSVTRDLPSTIQIEVRERKPIALINGEKLLCVDQEGYLLPYFRSKEIFDLPVITGLSENTSMQIGTKLQFSEVQSAIEILMTALANDPKLYHLISEINVRHGNDIVLYTAEHGVPVIFGKGDAMRKLLYLQSFWKNVVTHRGSRQLHYIDLRFNGEVVVK